MNTKDNLFILDFQKNDTKNTFQKRVVVYLIKFINSHNRFIKLYFGSEHLNRFFGIRYSIKYDTKINMLGHDTLNAEQAVNMWHFLSQVVLLDIPGDVVELGCFEGTGAMIIQKTLDQLGSKKLLHVYDSFEGLPMPSEQDGSNLPKVSFKSNEEILINNFSSKGIKLPLIHKGWFKDTLTTKLPERISFAHLDSDLYSSIMESLTYIYPRLSKGAVVIIDDYCDPLKHNVNNIYPGVKAACDEFFRDKDEKVCILIAGCESHGYFRKF